VPHIVIECSANLRERTDLALLVNRVHATALETGVFPAGGLRTRVAERDRYRIADGDPANAFCHVVVRIGHGRDAATKHAAAEAIFTTVCDALAPAFAATPLAISLELQEIDPALSFKRNNLHDHVARRAAHA
jgi:5-carboxymethyl-2-hydroxymuconate isomerase